MPLQQHLPPLSTQFVAHFGEMGSRWGINRTVGQIYALIFISQRALNADEIAEALEFSRSNVSMGLKELQAWRLVRLRHLPGDRREYFEAPPDVWEIFRVIVEERKRREIDPTLTVLRECVIEGGEDAALEKGPLNRMNDVLLFLEMLGATYDDYKHLPPATMQRFLKMGGKVARFLGSDDKDAAS